MSAKSQSSKAGCYSFNKVGSNTEEIELPLRSFSYNVELADSLAYLELQQIYFNSSNKTLDVQYIFPVNPKAAILNFEMSIGGRVMKGVVKSKEDAEKEFKQNQEENKGVGYGDYHIASAKDIMKVKIGNINANEEIKVKISYVHTVSIVYSAFYEFRLSTTITPRYVSRFDPHHLIFGQKIVKNMVGFCFWSLRMRIKSSRKVKSFFSKSHQLKPNLKQIDANTWEVVLDEQNLLPNKDFSLCYSFEDIEKPSVLLGETDKNTQAIISFIPKFCNLEIQDAKKQALQQKELPVSMSKTKGQYIFFLDRSGSMDGQRIAKAKQALIIFLKSLPENSYFNIISFGNEFKLLYPTSQNYQQSIIQSTIEEIKKMEANFGGTQILEALKDCMSKPPIPQYTRQIFLLTDGAVMNTASILTHVSLHTQYSRVHCIGIGNGISEDLIIGCAEQGKGHHVFVTDKEDPSEKIIQILDKSLSPVITKLNFTYDKEKTESILPNPQKTPYILKNQVCNFYFTFNGKLTSPTTIKIKYTDSLGMKYSQEVEITPQSALRCDYICKMVSFVELHALYSLYKYGSKQEDHIYYVKPINTEELQKKIIKESIDKQILTELTAFICVDGSLSDQLLKARQQEPKQSIKINPLNPIDHSLKVTFGLEDNELNMSNSDVYLDECCVVDHEPEFVSSYVAKDPLKNINLQQFKINPKSGKLKVIDAKNNSYVQIVGVKKQPGKDGSPLNAITYQLTNGMWNNDILQSLFNKDQLNLIKKCFDDKVPKEVWFTLAVTRHLKLFQQDSKKFELILRKAKEFIQNNVKDSYNKLVNLWKTEIRND